MEVQSPFTITFDELPGNLTFSEYLLDNRFPFFGKALALIDAESGRRWKYSELRGWVKHVLKNMEKEYISSNARIGVIAKNCPEMLILDVACGLIGITCTAMNPQGSIDELWHQVDLCDATNIITQGAFLSKAEEIKKKAQARGGGRLRNIHLFDAIVFQPGPEFEENVYGLTESCSTIAWSYHGCDNIKSIGAPLPGVVFKIVHPDKRHLLGPEQPGEMCVKGPQITPKYYKNMKATAELFDKDGFLKTGDLGYYDATGALYMVDRLKDAIKTKGSLVYPTEVENTLRSHPGIADIAVIGRPEASGEVPAAFIVREKGHPNLAAAEIRNFAKGKLAGFKELKGGIFFVQEIPRSATGKIMRRQLKGFWDRKDSNTGGSGNTTQTDRRGSMSQTNPDASPASRKSSAASQKVLSTKGNLVKK